MSAEIIHGDCLTVMPTLDADSVDAVVSDPPYGLAFMGKGWDHAVPGVEFWTAALRVAKPGAYLLAFGGTRTYHRLTCAIEDAGWEIHDCLSWLYGSGFPKHASKLKPAWEPIILARKPAKKATPLQVDACRIGDGERVKRPTDMTPCHGDRFGDPTITERRVELAPRVYTGRWPANVVLDEDAAHALDGQSGESKSSASLRHTAARPVSAAKGSESARITRGHGDTGGASRFFYTAKASRSERNAGLEGFAEGMGLAACLAPLSDPRMDRPQERRPQANVHPTVKPVALMRWLCRLVTPPDGLVLDPFTGSGTTGCAAVMEGLRFVGIEREAEYVAIARARIAHHATQGALALEPAA